MRFSLRLFILTMTLFALSACGDQKSRLAELQERLQNDRPLPILGQTQYDERVVDGQTLVDTVYHTIPEFAFYNQDSQIVNNQTLSDHIYVTDFFFSSCPSICPLMKQQMLRIHQQYRDHPTVRFVSFTLDPDHDTPEYLDEYADRLGVNTEQWMFLSGDKDEIYRLAEEGFRVNALTDENAPGGIVHDGAFTLVDKQGRIRGYYDGTKPAEVDKLVRAIERLLAEYERPNS